MVDTVRELSHADADRIEVASYEMPRYGDAPRACSQLSAGTAKGVRVSA